MAMCLNKGLLFPFPKVYATPTDETARDVEPNGKVLENLSMFWLTSKLHYDLDYNCDLLIDIL